MKSMERFERTVDMKLINFVDTVLEHNLRNLDDWAHDLDNGWVHNLPDRSVHMPQLDFGVHSFVMVANKGNPKIYLLPRLCGAFKQLQLE